MVQAHMTLKRLVRPFAAVALLLMLGLVIAACGKKTAPVTRPTPPPPPSGSSSTPPAPPEPVAEPTVVPPEPVPEDRIGERSLEELNRDSPFQPVFFEFDSAEILPQSESILMVGMQALRDNPDVRVEIGGHTDNQGSAAYNRDLSRRRAQSVHDWMVAHGIDANRMRVRGYGLSRPVASNDTPEGQAQNRRIEFTTID